MAKPKVCVLRPPGTNCDVETAHAFDMCGAHSERVHLFRLLDDPSLLQAYQILCIPGGFSYGDDVGAGVIFAAQLRTRLADAVRDFLQADTLTLGICNGFQVLVKAGILPGDAAGWAPAVAGARPVTLTWNDNGRYTACWVRLRVASDRNAFLRGIEEIDLPIAHGEGKLVVRDERLLDDWQAKGQLALRYVPPPVEKSVGRGSDPAAAALPWPYNPNGSMGDVAGLGDETGRILGLMPHPERHLHATQHPCWTARGLSGHGEGLRLFQNGVDYFM